LKKTTPPNALRLSRGRGASTTGQGKKRKERTRKDPMRLAGNFAKKKKTPPKEGVGQGKGGRVV